MLQPRCPFSIMLSQLASKPLVRAISRSPHRRSRRIWRTRSPKATAIGSSAFGDLGRGSVDMRYTSMPVSHLFAVAAHRMNRTDMFY